MICMRELERLSRVSVLLVAVDFDGTIAPIVADPSAARADGDALKALRTLAQTPQTHVAIISGRSLDDLEQRTGPVEGFHLVGSHGGEWQSDKPVPLSSNEMTLYRSVSKSLHGLVNGHAGISIEEKPASLALHYRNAEEHIAQAVIAAVLQGPARWPGIHVRNGKKVIELSINNADKGRALQRLRERVGATAVLFIGDDITDEDAFAALGTLDIGIKVGPGESKAGCRADNPEAVARILTMLSDLRRTH